MDLPTPKGDIEMFGKGTDSRISTLIQTPKTGSITGLDLTKLDNIDEADD